MKSSKSNSLTKSRMVGDYVSKEVFVAHTRKYKKAFPNTASSFAINKNVLRKVLQLSDQLMGIRFMYGISDVKNPNSMKILLIPCTSRHDYDTSTQAIISHDGYYDHNGQAHSLVQCCAWIANFVKHVQSNFPALAYKEITRGNYFGKESLLELMKEEECAHLLLHFGLAEQRMQPILVPINATFEPVLDVYMNFSRPCPPYCGDPGESDICLATKIINHCSSEEELNEYRAFRDQNLLQLPDGEIYYELYYFISPLISHLIADQKENLQHIYQEKMVPFRNLLAAQKHEEALAHLRATLEEWVDTYEMDFIESEARSLERKRLV